MARVGRPTKYHPERVEAILQSLRNGAPRAKAALAAGITRETLRVWALDLAFSDALEKAEAEFVTSNVAIIQRAADTQWQAAAWLLERREHADFGRRDRVDMAVDVRTRAQRVAAERGLDVERVMAEAEAILAG